MKCNHVHKDSPENAVCEDCFDKGYRLGTLNAINKLLDIIMKGGLKNDNKNN